MLRKRGGGGHRFLCPGAAESLTCSAEDPGPAPPRDLLSAAWPGPATTCRTNPAMEAEKTPGI